MATILTVNKSGLGNFPRGASCQLKRRSDKNLRVLCINKRTVGRRETAVAAKKQGSTEIGLTGAVAILISVVVICGAFYLYQVNALVSKGYAVQRLESQIADLQKANDNGNIQETELRSMYNIEKSTQNLGLVSSSDATYLELNGPVAMK
jgi:cell division protein FtsL